MSTDVSFSGNEADGFVVGEELESLYLLLEKSIPELQWQSPGRIEEEPQVENPTTESNAEMQKAKPAKNDFDFSDDFGPQQSNRSRVTPKSAKKKTANFADVLKRIGK